MKKRLLIALMILIVINLAFLLMPQSAYGQENIISDTISLKEVSVNGSYSAVKETPFTFKNLDLNDIQSNSQNMEPAILLSTTPSVTVYSDNGLGLGYIYYRLRGIDQTRINSTLNGVPLNEPEDQGIYYNNYGNFLNSVKSVQIIRGAGLSKPGVSSYAGSINFNSLDFANEPEGYATMVIGSYGTNIVSVGLNSSKFFINASLSSTDGYKHNSFNESQSLFYGAKLMGDNLKVYGFIGHQQNGMAWLGESLENIEIDPQYNSNTSNETDDFLNIHNQFIFTLGNVTATFYHTYLNGWYDTEMAHFDPSIEYGDFINRLSLESHWIGSNMNHKILIKNAIEINYGLSAYTYFREHTVTYNMYDKFFPAYQPYTNTGFRDEVSPYLKGMLDIGKFTFLGDIQYRYTTFSYIGDVAFDPIEWNFINWSGGVSYQIDNYSNLYLGIGETNREPTRTDLFRGSDSFWGGQYVLQPIIPESVISTELGYKYLNNDLALSVNFYYMSFKNELVLNGQIGPNSILLHQNVDESYRRGIEFDFVYKLDNGLEFSGVGNFSHNRITEDGKTFSPILTPEIILSGDTKYNFGNSYIGINLQYSGESYIDFANEHILTPTTVLNTYIGTKFNNFTIRGNLNNVTDELILGNAIMAGDTPMYYVMAGINGSLSVTLKF